MTTTINQELKELYSDYIPLLNNALNECDGLDKGLSYPLLINAFDDFLITNKRIMFIGKETYGWWVNDKDATIKKDSLLKENIVDILMKNYSDFNLGKQYYSTPFWDFCHKIFKRITDSNSENGFIWNNISKIDQRQSTPNWDILKPTLECFPILEKELLILKPDIVIFLTGNSHDRILEKVFKGLKFEIIEPKILAKLTHSSLPFHTYRTYHPKYLRINKIENQIVDTLTRLICRQ